jgi:hypothetical protein
MDTHRCDDLFDAASEGHDCVCPETHHTCCHIDKKAN